MKIKDYLKKVNIDEYISFEAKYELNKIDKKAKHHNHFIDNVVIRVVVNNINRATLEFTNNDILYVIDSDISYLLSIVCSNKSQYLEETIDVIFIEDKASNIRLHNLFNYTVHYAKCIAGIKTQHKLFEESYKDSDTCRYVYKGRKSIINSFFRFDTRKPYRIELHDLILPILPNSKLESKYIYLNCPICSEEFEITKETIDKIIVVDKTNKITFNCLHKKSPEFKSKFNISLIDYQEYIPPTTKERTVQMWFIDNFIRLINEDK